MTKLENGLLENADKIIDDNFEVFAAFDVVDGHLGMKEYLRLCKEYRE